MPGILSTVIERYGAGIGRDARRLEAVLRDLCGARRRDIHVLVAAARLGIPSELALAKHANLAARYAVQRLCDECGLTREHAAWAVREWMAALGHEPDSLDDLETDAAPPPLAYPRIVHAYRPSPTAFSARSPDGHLLAVAEAGEAIIYLRRTLDGEQICSLHHPGPVAALAFSTDGRRLAVTGPAAELHIWQLYPNPPGKD